MVYLSLFSAQDRYEGTHHTMLMTPQIMTRRSLSVGVKLLQMLMMYRQVGAWIA